MELPRFAESSFASAVALLALIGAATLLIQAYRRLRTRRAARQAAVDSMSLDAIRISAREHVLIVLVCSSILVIGAHSEWFMAVPKWLQILLKELGFAGLVAVLLIFILERYSKARHEAQTKMQIEEINKDLFLAVYRRRLSPGVRAELQTCLFDSKVSRDDVELTYKLESIKNPSVEHPSYPSEELIKLNQSCRYEAKNMTLGTVTHDFGVYIELPPLPELNKYCAITRFATKRQGLAEWEEHIPKDAPVLATESDRTSLRFSKKLSIGADETIQVASEAHFMKNLFDTETWASMLPTEKIKLLVIVPTSGLKVEALAQNSSELDYIKRDESVHEWSLDNGMLPHQSVAFWWSPANLPQKVT